MDPVLTGSGCHTKTAKKKHPALTRDYTKRLKKLLARDADWNKYWFWSGFHEEDRFITLTFRPHMRIDEYQRTKTVDEFLKRLNRAVYGADFTKRGKRLSYCGFFEISPGGSLHLHALISAPENIDRLNGESFDHLIIRTWKRLALAGEHFAQHSTDMYDVERVLDYMMKDVTRPKHYANFDVLNHFCPRSK